MSLQSRLTVEFPLASGALKTNFETKERVVANSNFLLGLLKGRTTVVSLAAEYADSYKNVATKTVLHYRDFLLSEALLESLVNMQYLNTAKTQLTNAAARVWDTYSYDQIWRYLPPVSTNHIASNKVSDVLGSIAFYFKSTDTTNFYPQQILEDALRYVWYEFGLDYNLALGDRFDSLIQSLGLNSNLLNRVAVPIPADEQELLQALRKNGFSIRSLIDLPTRIFLGEYSDLELSLRSSLFTESDKAKFDKILFNCSAILRPAGLPLLLQAVAIEGLLKATQVLQNLPVELLRTNLDSFRSLVGQQDVFYEIVRNLASSYDAYTLLGKYSTVAGVDAKAKSIANLMFYWLSVSGQSSAASTDKTRIQLGAFYQSNTVDLSDSALANDSFFAVLQEQAPKGDPKTALILNLVNKTASTTTVATTDLFGKPVAATLSSIFSRGLQVSVASEPSVGVFVLTNFGTGSASIIATPVGSELPTIDDYLSSREGIVASNPITITSQEETTPVSAGVDAQIQELIDLYQTSFALRNLSTPTGSADDVYRRNGITPPREVDHRVIIDAFKDKIYGARTENTSRMVALHENVSDHLEKAIKNALDWAKEQEEL